MSAIVCEVCGKPSSIHLTDVDPTRVPQKVDHHYCREHAPPEIQAKLGGPEDEARRVEQMIAQLDARDLDPAETAEFRRELEKLAEDIRAGRKRFGDAD
jgi:hypothetical protein